MAGNSEVGQRYGVIGRRRHRHENFIDRDGTKPFGGLWRIVLEEGSAAMPPSKSHADYRLGTLYSVATVLLLSTQEPFSSLAAKRLSSFQFICLTQISLLLPIPLLRPHAP